jgi:hypothetical protein
MLPSENQNSAVQANEIEHLICSDKEQWEHINGLEKALQKFVPVWTTIVLTVMGTVTGSALTCAVMFVKFAGIK